MKALRIIQVLAKVMRVICLVIFILTIIGAVFTLLGLIIVPVLQDQVLYDGKTLQMLLLEKNISMAQVYAGLSVGLLSTGVGIFLAKYNESFFAYEIKEGTPFKMEVVKRTRKNALVNIIVSISLVILSIIVVGIISGIYKTKFNFNYSLVSSVGYGLALLVISLFCEYGAEKDEKVEVIESKEEDK